MRRIRISGPEYSIFTSRGQKFGKPTSDNLFFNLLFVFFCLFFNTFIGLLATNVFPEKTEMFRSKSRNFPDTFWTKSGCFPENIYKLFRKNPEMFRKSSGTNPGTIRNISEKFRTTRDHGSFGRRHQVEMLPTGLPELFKHARDLLEPRKPPKPPVPSGSPEWVLVLTGPI